jgi:hypothetical protein
MRSMKINTQLQAAADLQHARGGCHELCVVTRRRLPQTAQHTLMTLPRAFGPAEQHYNPQTCAMATKSDHHCHLSFHSGWISCRATNSTAGACCCKNTASLLHTPNHPLPHQPRLRMASPLPHIQLALLLLLLLRRLKHLPFPAVLGPAHPHQLECHPAS